MLVAWETAAGKDRTSKLSRQWIYQISQTDLVGETNQTQVGGEQREVPHLRQREIGAVIGGEPVRGGQSECALSQSRQRNRFIQELAQRTDRLGRLLMRDHSATRPFDGDAGHLDEKKLRRDEAIGRPKPCPGQIRLLFDEIEFGG